MKAIKFLLAGIFFGIVMFKSEAASWYRIFEMFQFDAFHMYGVMGSALVVGVIGIQIIKQFKVNFEKPIELCEKQKGYKRYLFGGTIFGLGWAFLDLPRPYVYAIGSRIFTHSHCDYLSYCRHLCLWLVMKHPHIIK